MARALFSFRGSLHGLKLESGKFTKALDDAAERLVRGATREWLRAVITRIPIWTGFAQGSIKFAQGPNGDLARFLNVSIPITAKHEFPRWYYSGSGGRVLKTPENAGRFSEYNFPTTQHRYRFRFTSGVIHLLINDFYSSVSPTSPWEAMEAGKKAFIDYIRFNQDKLPKIKDFIVKGQIVEFGDGSG